MIYRNDLPKSMAIHDPPEEDSKMTGDDGDASISVENEVSKEMVNTYKLLGAEGRCMDLFNIPDILSAGGATPLEPLSLWEDLEDIKPVAIIQRLIWTSVTKWSDLQRLRTRNLGLRVAFSEQNAALLCNFVIKTRYTDAAEWLGLDISSPVSSKWLEITGDQVSSIKLVEQSLFKYISRTMSLSDYDRSVYKTALSFFDPGPALLFGLESGMVYTDRHTGCLRGGLQQDIAKNCLLSMTAPWFITPAFGGFLAPRSEHPAITWFYVQAEDRYGAEEAVEKVLA